MQKSLEQVRSAKEPASADVVDLVAWRLELERAHAAAERIGAYVRGDGTFAEVMKALIAPV